MAESIVSDWLADYAAIEKSEIRTFAAEHEHNHDISNALFTIINERLKYPDVSALVYLFENIVIMCIIYYLFLDSSFNM